MTDTDLKPCPNPWCSHTNGLYVVWDLYSRRVCCRCGVKGPMSETKANTTQGVPINDSVQKQADKEAAAAWNTRPSPTREAIAVKPLEWDGLVSGAYEIRIEEGGIADLYFYGERDEDGSPVLLKGAYLTLVDLDEFKEIAQKHHAEQMAKLVNLTPSPVAGWREDVVRFLTSGDYDTIIKSLRRAWCEACDGSGERNDAEPGDIGFNTWACGACDGKGWNRQAIQEIVDAVDLPPSPGQQPATEQPSDPWAFNEPYSLKREETALSGTVFWLMSNGVSIASYAVRNWGSEDACIKAAWRHAYEPEQPSVAEAALEEAAELLRDFRDYATTFAPGGAHTNPIWSKVADFMEIYGPFEDDAALRTLQGDG